MKKVLFSLLAISMLSPLSIKALEKSGLPSEDLETLRIEESMGEHPQERLLFKQKLNELDKSVLTKRIEELELKVKKATGAAKEKINAKIQAIKDALKAKLQ